MPKITNLNPKIRRDPSPTHLMRSRGKDWKGLGKLTETISFSQKGILNEFYIHHSPIIL